MRQTTTFEHIGAARQYEGTLRIDIKTMQAVISRSDLIRLLDRWAVDVFDISDVMRTAGEPSPVGRAWISRSGKAVMYLINGIRYVSPLSQVKGAVSGERKYANVSIMREISGSPAVSSSSAAEVAA
ncbi:MAG TPA: hypothetical protein PLC20_11330 [Flavobacteriales bacterium]|nr:hypothetical protein [Flavobacteriales bacterium]